MFAKKLFTNVKSQSTKWPTGIFVTTTLNLIITQQDTKFTKIHSIFEDTCVKNNFDKTQTDDTETPTVFQGLVFHIGGSTRNTTALAVQLANTAHMQ